MKSRRAFLVEPGRMEIQDVQLTPGPGQVLVRVAACGLCNWEQNHWHGLLGECPQPLGHEWGGMIVEAGEGVTWLKPGDAVTGLPDSLTGFSEYLVTSAHACHKLAPHIQPDAAFGEPLKCVVTVLRAAAPEAGDIGIVLGCGPMGLWTIQALRGNLLSKLIAIDLAPEKLALAKSFGATNVINPKDGDVLELLGDITNGHMADFVIEGTGVPELITQATTYLKPARGRLIIMSAHERPAQQFDWRPVQNKGITLIGAHPSYCPDEGDDLRRAVSMINNNTFSMEGVINYTFRLDDIQTAFETLAKKPSDYIKGIVIP